MVALKIERNSPETVTVTLENSNLESVTILPTTQAIDISPEHADHKPELLSVRNKAIILPEGWRKAVIEIRLCDVET